MKTHAPGQGTRWDSWTALFALALLACSRSAGNAPAAAPPVAALQEAQVLDADIAFYERRLTEDPSSAADRARISTLYLRRSRETGNYQDVERAADQAARSLRLREGRNESSWSVLGSARLAQHDFVGALEAARQLVRLAPEQPSHRAFLAEVLLELGRYAESDSLFLTVEPHSSSLSVAPRLVRWYEINGHLGRAKVLALHALELARSQRDTPAEQLAWFHLRAGDIMIKSGDLRAADSLYALGLLKRPGDYRLLAARARVASREGRWQDAIAYADSSIATVLEPGTLGLLRDAWLAVGDTVQAEGYAAAMTTSVLTQPGPVHRAWGMHLVEHREQVPEVLRRVRAELRTRRDVYGYELEAWALHALGRHAEAWASARKALSRGTQDEMLLRRMATIARSAGAGDSAMVLEARALALHPATARPSPGGMQP